MNTVVMFCLVRMSADRFRGAFSWTTATESRGSKATCKAYSDDRGRLSVIIRQFFLNTHDGNVILVALINELMLNKAWS